MLPPAIACGLAWSMSSAAPIRLSKTVCTVPRDLDAELVDPAAAGDLAVVAGQPEVVSGDAVDRAGAPELGLELGDDQPLIGLAVEVEVADLELELGLPVGRGAAVLVLRRRSRSWPCRSASGQPGRSPAATLIQPPPVTKPAEGS